MLRFRTIFQIIRYLDLKIDYEVDLKKNYEVCDLKMITDYEIYFNFLDYVI